MRISRRASAYRDALSKALRTWLTACLLLSAQSSYAVVAYAPPPPTAFLFVASNPTTLVAGPTFPEAALTFVLLDANPSPTPPATSRLSVYVSGPTGTSTDCLQAPNFELAALDPSQGSDAYSFHCNVFAGSTPGTISISVKAPDAVGAPSFAQTIIVTAPPPPPPPPTTITMSANPNPVQVPSTTGVGSTQVCALANGPNTAAATFTATGGTIANPFSGTLIQNGVNTGEIETCAQLNSIGLSGAIVTACIGANCAPALAVNAVAELISPGTIALTATPATIALPSAGAVGSSQVCATVTPLPRHGTATFSVVLGTAAPLNVATLGLGTTGNACAPINSIGAAGAIVTVSVPTTSAIGQTWPSQSITINATVPPPPPAPKTLKLSVSPAGPLVGAQAVTLAAQLLDQYGNGMPGVALDLTDNGAAIGSAPVTGPNGALSLTWTAPVGTNALLAAVHSAPQVKSSPVSLIVNPAPVATKLTLSVTPAGPLTGSQQVTVTAKVLDQNGNGMSGVALSLQQSTAVNGATSSGAIGSGLTTNASGAATVAWTAPVGLITLTASTINAPHLTSNAVALTVNPAGGSTSTGSSSGGSAPGTTSGSPYSITLAAAAANLALGQQSSARTSLLVHVSDRDHHPVIKAPVTLAIASGSGTLSLSATQTDSSGNAQAAYADTQPTLALLKACTLGTGGHMTNCATTTVRVTR